MLTTSEVWTLKMAATSNTSQFSPAFHQQVTACNLWRVSALHVIPLPNHSAGKTRPHRKRASNR